MHGKVFRTMWARGALRIVQSYQDQSIGPRSMTRRNRKESTMNSRRADQRKEGQLHTISGEQIVKLCLSLAQLGVNTEKAVPAKSIG